MRRSLRSTLLLLLAVLALGAGACGVEAGSATLDDGATTTDTETDTGDTEDTDGPPRSDDPARQTVIDTYEQLGFTPEEAECLADSVLDLIGEEDPYDTTAMMDAINQCDIPMSRLADIGEQAGGSIEDGMRFGLETSFQNQGLSESEAACVADEYISEYGTEVEPSQDPQVLGDILAACGLSISDLDN